MKDKLQRFITKSNESLEKKSEAGAKDEPMGFIDKIDEPLQKAAKELQKRYSITRVISLKC